MRKLLNSELQRKSVDEFRTSLKTPLILVLDDVRSLHNIGSIFRSADAFLIEKIYLCGITATPPHRDISKTALGATDTVDWEYARDIAACIEKLHEQNIIVFAVEQVENSISLDKFEAAPQMRYALILGNEVFGVSEKALEKCDGSVEIPQVGSKHSLNVSVTAGIVVWEFFRKLQALRAPDQG